MAAKPEETAPKRRGRPVVLSAEERRALILDAVGAVFADGGMETLTMTAVAERAGMSKRTLYDLYTDQTSLILAFMERLRNGFFRPLDPADEALPLEDRLRQMLEPRLDLPISELPIEVLRIGVASGGTDPLLGRACLERGPCALREMIRAELDRGVARGELPPTDTAQAAALLKDMVQIPVLDLLLDPARRPSLAEMRARFELGLTVFLRGTDAR
ncbi:TetR/AcrR family transcriptional regulator [Pseudoroseicyclus aestuarii]|uniref:TetR family transcriptional regulator n=1 Tax=Pseudoroseicyclus aestuarii TaxID=1795041 RepID=A0A318SYU8_9RHOB|nr:TetR/AcrR family transcriptional regulator [Pseudoroseicyclus aestuarii]PYE85566.1 TetR family transcriptional regulator [Pseudoroseicyclus aestuarii]